MQRVTVTVTPFRNRKLTISDRDISRHDHQVNYRRSDRIIIRSLASSREHSCVVGVYYYYSAVIPAWGIDIPISINIPTADSSRCITSKKYAFQIK